MITLGLSDTTPANYANRTFIIRCNTCHHEIQSLGRIVFCGCPRDSDTTVAVSGNVYCEDIYCGPRASYANTGKR